MPSDVVELYRITHERFADSPFSGEGGLYYASRWASKGQRVAYAADHLALAVLEKMAGVQRAKLLTEMIYARAKIATRCVEYLSDDDRPEGWDALPAGEATRQLGDAWLREEQSLVLRVPSVLLPHSYNFVINASHPDVEALEVVEVRSLLLDNRVLRLVGAPKRTGPP